MHLLRYMSRCLSDVFPFFDDHFLGQVQISGRKTRGDGRSGDPQQTMNSLLGCAKFTYPVEQEQICFSCRLKATGDSGGMSWNLSDGIFDYQEGYWT